MPSKYGLDLVSLWGDRFKNNFNPLTRNIRTGAVSHKSHHCGECDAAAVKKCYIAHHIAFCLAPVIDKDGNEVICGERFTVSKADGCGTHQVHDTGDVNRIFRTSMRGKELKAFVPKVDEEPPEVPVEPPRVVDENEPWRVHDPQPVYKDKPQNLPKIKARTGKIPLAPTLKQLTRQSRRGA